MEQKWKENNEEMLFILNTFKNCKMHSKLFFRVLYMSEHSFKMREPKYQSQMYILVFFQRFVTVNKWSVIKKWEPKKKKNGVRYLSTIYLNTFFSLTNQVSQQKNWRHYKIAMKKYQNSLEKQHQSIFQCIYFDSLKN